MKLEIFGALFSLGLYIMGSLGVIVWISEKEKSIIKQFSPKLLDFICQLQKTCL